MILERPPTSIIAAGYNAVLHIHAAIEEVSVKALICLIDRKTGEKIPKPRFVKQDQTCVMRLESSELFCLEPFSEFQQLGRFTLRDEGIATYFHFVFQKRCSKFLRFQDGQSQSERCWKLLNETEVRLRPRAFKRCETALSNFLGEAQSLFCFHNKCFKILNWNQLRYIKKRCCITILFIFLNCWKDKL